MCRLRNIAMRDYQESVTTGQTHGQSQTDSFADDTKIIVDKDKQTGQKQHAPDHSRGIIKDVSVVPTYHTMTTGRALGRREKFGLASLLAPVTP